MGHVGENCRVGSRHEWRPKPQPTIDSKGFQTVHTMKSKAGVQGIITPPLAIPSSHNTPAGLPDLLPINNDFTTLENLEEEYVEEPPDGYIGLDTASRTAKLVIDSPIALGVDPIQDNA